jgi:hypothetical protein
MNFHTMPLTMLPKARSRALLDATHDMPCELRIASFLGRPCRGSVMPVHLDFTTGKGMGTKVTDLAVVAGCDACHRLLDWRDKTGAEFLREKYPTALMEQVLRALIVTHGRLLGLGIITVQGHEDNMEGN